MVHRIHTALVTAYLIAGIALIITTPMSELRGYLLNGGGSTLMELSAEQSREMLHGAAENTEHLSNDAAAAARRATAGRQLVLGTLLFTLGGFVHAYGRVRNERPVHITVKKRKPRTLFWVQMNV